jgi:NADH:ubiquinone oxidoreductase subunit C
MFKSLKSLLDQRLGSLIVQDDLALAEGYFIKVDPSHLNAASYFLKHDPDTRLTLLDQIIVIKTKLLPWKNDVIDPQSTHEIIYQLKSLKLPYRVNIVIESNQGASLIPSIASLFAGARWLESDISKKFKFDIDES